MSRRELQAHVPVGSDVTSSALGDPLAARRDRSTASVAAAVTRWQDSSTDLNVHQYEVAIRLPFTAAISSAVTGALALLMPVAVTAAALLLRRIIRKNRSLLADAAYWLMSRFLRRSLQLYLTLATFTASL